MKTLEPSLTALLLARPTIGLLQTARLLYFLKGDPISREVPEGASSEDFARIAFEPSMRHRQALSTIFDKLGDCYWALGKEDKARRYFTRAEHYTDDVGELAARIAFL